MSDKQQYYCNDCGKPCEVIKYDDSFGYAGVHCSHGQPGTEEVYHLASDCCDASYTQAHFFMCKCGFELELHPEHLDTKRCTACFSIGTWTDNY